MRFLSFLISFFAITNHCIAEKDLLLDTVTVRASENEMMSMSFKVFDRSQFINGYENLSDFLDQQSGMQIQQSGGLGNPALVSIRGANSSQTQFMINGITINNSQYGSYDLNSVPLNQIERIEISRSASSFDLIDHAIGGTINIITRQPDKIHSLSLGYGSESTVKFSTSNQIWQGAALQLDHEQSENDYEFPVPSPFNDSQNRNQIQSLNNAKFKRSSLQLVQQVDSLLVTARLNEQDKNIPDYFRNHPDNTARLSQQNFSFTASDQHQFIYNSSLMTLESQHKWQFFLNKINEQYKDLDGLIGLGTDNDRFSQYKIEIQGQSKFKIKNWQVQGQLQAFEEGFSSRYINDSDSFECTTPQGNCDQLAFEKSLIALIAGKWTNKKQNQQLTLDLYRKSNASFNRQRHSSKHSNKDQRKFYGYNAQYGFYFDQFETLFSLKKSQKIPSLYQRFGDRGLLLGNSDLVAEIGQTLSVDIVARLGSAHELSSSIFHRYLENAIVPVYDSRGVGRYENSSQATLTGIESQWRFRSEMFYGQASIDLYDSLVTDPNVKSFDQKHLAGIYHTSFGILAGWKSGNHHLHLKQNFNTRLYIDRSNLINGEEHAITSANYQYQYKNFVIGGKIKNLTDNEYKDFTNRPAIGRQWHLYLNYSY